MHWKQVVGAGLVVGLLVGVATAARAGGVPKQVLVVNTGDASVSLVDLAGMQEVKRYPVGPRPYGIAVSQDGKTVAVGVEDEEKVKFFSFPDFKPKGEVKIGKMFNDHIVLTKDGKHILVANFYSDDVVGIDIATMKEEFRIKDCSAPHVVRYGPLGKHIFVTCKKITGVAVIDPEGRKLLKFHQLVVNPRSLTFSPDESKVYFGSFWVNGIFEADLKTGKVTRLFSADPPKDSADNQEVTYHGVQAMHGNIILAANEGRSYVDAFDMATAQHLSRFSDVSKPCCIEPIPGNPNQVLFSNIGDGTLQRVAVSRKGNMKSLGKAQVGKAPKRVAFLSDSSAHTGAREPEESRVTSGPQVGKSIPGTFHPFYIVNAEDPDRVNKRSEPIWEFRDFSCILIFARETGENLINLLKKVDGQLAKGKPARFTATLVMLSDEDQKELASRLRRLALKNEIKNLSLTIMPSQGPRAYKIAKEADLTIILLKDLTVTANHALRKGELNARVIEAVVSELAAITRSPDQKKGAEVTPTRDGKRAALPGGRAEKLKSGPQVGAPIPGPFQPLNVTGPFAGKRSCLVEAYGARPVAMIFARELSTPVVSLVKKIEAANAKNPRMGSFAVFLTEDDNVMTKLKGLAEKEAIEKCVLCVDKASGTLRAYRLSQEAEVTVILYTNHKVQANLTFRKGELDEMGIEGVMTELKTISAQ